MTDELGREARNRPPISWIVALFCWLMPLQAIAQIPDQTRVVDAIATYKVQVGDALSVTIWGWPTPSAEKLEGRFPVESTGRVYLPVVGMMDVAGKTTERVQTELRQKFAAEQAQAVIVVEPLFMVSVNGQVRDPNVYDFRPGQTVFDALSRAGGYTVDANLKELLLVRGGEARTLSASSANELAALISTTTLQSGDRLLVHSRSRIPLSTFLTGIQTIFAAITLYTVLSR